MSKGYLNDVWVLNDKTNVILKLVDGVIATTTTLASPFGICVDKNNVVWVTNNNNNVTKIVDGVIVKIFTVGAGARGICVDKNNVIWVAYWGCYQISKIENDIVTDFATPKIAWGICCDKNNVVWVASNSGDVYKTINGIVVKTIPVGNSPRGICCDRNNVVWVTNNGSNNVSRIENDVVTTTINVGKNPTGICVDKNNVVWVANNRSDSVSKIENGIIVKNVNIGQWPEGICVDKNNVVWVANWADGSVSRIENDVVKTIAIPGYPTNTGDATGMQSAMLFDWDTLITKTIDTIRNTHKNVISNTDTNRILTNKSVTKITKNADTNRKTYKKIDINIDTYRNTHLLFNENIDTCRKLTNVAFCTKTDTFDSDTRTFEFTGDWFKDQINNENVFRSKVIPDSETTSTQLKINLVADGHISFDYKYQSEQDYDFFIFSIDGVEKLNESGANIDEWIKFSVDLIAGTHTFLWTYSKDSSGNADLDLACIKNVEVQGLEKPISTSTQITKNIDTIRKTKIQISKNTDTIRKKYEIAKINVDAKRILTNAIQPVMGVDMGIKTITIATGIQSLADRVAIETIGKPYSGVKNFNGDLFGFKFYAEKATITENRNANGTTYTTTSKPDSNGLNYNVNMTFPALYYNGGVIIGRTAKQLCAMWGIEANITDFTPLGIGTYTQKAGTFTIKEKSLKSFLDKLFGWSSDFAHRQMYITLRNGVVVVNEVGRYTTLYNINDATKYKIESVNMTRQQILKFVDYDDTTPKDKPTPTPGGAVLTVNYANHPFTGTTSFGESSLVYEDGLLMSETNPDNTTEYVYDVASSFAFDNSKQVLKSKTTLNKDNDKKTVTNYEYDVVTHGSTVSPDLDVSLLSEHTISTSKDNLGNWQTDSEHITTHTPLGNGFFGQRTEEIDGTDKTTVAHSISRGSCGGLASLYTQKQYSGYTLTKPDKPVEKPDDFLGELKNGVNIPVAEISNVNSLIGVVNWMNKKIEETISISVIVQPNAPLIDALRGAIEFDGNLYYIQSTNAVINEKSYNQDSKTLICRQQISAVRWFENV